MDSGGEWGLDWQRKRDSTTSRGRSEQQGEKGGAHMLGRVSAKWGDRLGPDPRGPKRQHQQRGPCVVGSTETKEGSCAVRLDRGPPPNILRSKWRTTAHILK